VEAILLYDAAMRAEMLPRKPIPFRQKGNTKTTKLHARHRAQIGSQCSRSKGEAAQASKLFRKMSPSACVDRGFSIPSHTCKMAKNVTPSFALHMVYRIPETSTSGSAFLISLAALSNSFPCVAFTLKGTVCIVTKRSSFSETEAINLTRHCHRSDD
jgi:hypothetical protein